MRRIILSLCAIGCISGAYAQNALNKKISGDQGVSKQFVKLESAEQVSFNPKAANSAFGLDSKSDLVLLNSETDKLGQTHYRYYQTYNGIPVENSMYIAHTKGNTLTGASGTVITRFSTQAAARSSAGLSSASAISAALNYVHAEKYAWEDADFEQRVKFRKGAGATYYPVPEKVWFSNETLVTPEALTLAYKIDVYSLKPFDRRFIYIDAATGKVLGEKQEMMHSDAVGTAATGYSGTQTIHSDMTGTNAYRLRDYTKGNGIITLHAASGHADYTNTSANWALTGTDQWALDAHFGVAATWTYYKNNFNRNSVDNAGYALTSWVNDTKNKDNADWDGSEMDYGNLSDNGNGVTAIDVTGHELTHGVTQYTCALVYNREPGAMNESLSDMAGKSVQFYTKPTDTSWILSNDMGWEIRSFSNPNADGQPDTYLGKYWVNTSKSNFLNDYGGVHTNSGVGNYMFYLLVMGGSGVNDIDSAYSVNGIGLAEADQIIYRTQTVYLTSTSKYADFRTGCISAATDLYGAGSNEVKQVQNAWHAVGIGTAGGAGTSCSVPTGLAAGTITATSAVLSWTAVPGAAGYTLQYKLASAGTYTTISGITSSTYTLTGLTSGTAYNAQIATVCSGGGSSAYSSPVTFTTTTVKSCNGTYDGSSHNTFATAVIIPASTDINGTISSSTDVDYFKLTVSGSGTATITLTTLPANYDLYIYNSAQKLVASSTNTGTTSESLTKAYAAGTYYLKVIGVSGAFNTTTCYTLKVTVAPKLEFANGFSNQIPFGIYPNPVSSLLNVNVSSASSGATMKVIDIYGKTILLKQLTSSNAQLSVSRLSAGTYMLMIINKNGSIVNSSKFVKQ